jgi:hypothetical protein
MFLGWSSTKLLFFVPVGYSIWLPGPIFNNNATALWQPSWWESATAGHNFGRGKSNDYVIKVWFQLSNWFQTMKFKKKILL